MVCSTLSTRPLMRPNHRVPSRRTAGRMAHVSTLCKADMDRSANERKEGSGKSLRDLASLALSAVVFLAQPAQADGLFAPRTPVADGNTGEE
jgi:hypothetical protein